MKNRTITGFNFSNHLFLLCLLLLFLNGETLLAQENIGYQMPPKGIAALIDAPRTPSARISPDGKWILLLERPAYPPIEELAQEELRLAGLRINPKNNGASRSYYYINLKLMSIKDKKEIQIKELPSNARIENVIWSPDSKKIAFTIVKTDGIELWIVIVKNYRAKKLTEPTINDVYYDNPYVWLSDSKTLIYKSVKEDRGAPPKVTIVPDGPVIQENTGKKAPVRTYQDLLKNAYDEALFEYYMLSQLTRITIEGKSKKLGFPGIVKRLSPSPDGKYLLVETIKHPFSYLVPSYRFPTLIEIWDMEGNVVDEIANLPSAENIPKGFGAVAEGPRACTWRSDVPATLYWIEAQDEGDPAKEATVRDKLFSLTAPFTEEPSEVLSLNLRYERIIWGNDDLAIVYEWWWKNRRNVTSLFNPDSQNPKKQILFDRSWEDRYNDPGDFITTYNKYGKKVLLIDDNNKSLYLIGEGASPEGNRPFVDNFDLKTKNPNRLWRSQAPYYEKPLRIIDVENGIVLTRRESQKIPPNYFLRNLKNGKLIKISDFPHPYPQLKNVKKQILKYKREDGIKLTANLYLPPNYKKEKPLPVLMWAYPQEYKSADLAGQVKDSPYRFIRIGWWSPVLWVTQGYAILDNPSMPIIGEGDEEPNDTYIEQLTSSAKAAIDKLEEMGIADRNRIAIGGHSYGAFMTGNLLAHSNLFKAGIARSGAYNRTLTPFGFQAEERTLWEAPETYIKMSPFMYADKINEPILLIHGEADNNSGTYPMQSERFYGALKGHGKTVRLIMLPHESHGYRARESIMHMLWETDRWLNKYVKNKNNN